MALLLIVGGTLNVSRATNVTYHILTLPIDPTVYDYHMKSEITGWRLEAVKVIANNQSKLELPAQYKSPLATGFTYYKASDVAQYYEGTAQNLFDNGPIKGVLYQIKGEETPDDDGDDATPVGEGATLSGSTAEYYVVYTYNASNGIAKLDGSEHYNIKTKYKDNSKNWQDKGFIALNRGRNNRPAVMPTAKVDPEMLASEDFMQFAYEVNNNNYYILDTKISAYWKDNNNKNKVSDVAGQFYFMFKFEGKDPYNIIIRTAYAKDTTYIEKNDGTNNFVYKWYKEGSLLAVSSGNNCYIASDEHKLYNIAYNTSTYPTNPTDLREGAGLGYTSKPGNYHGQTGVVWNSVALLPNNDNSGYVFMVTRTVDANGAINNTLYYLKEKDNCNNLNFASGNSSDNLSIVGIYPIEKVTFKVVTPFGNIVSVADQVSKYTVDNDPIETKYLPAALKRKYCNYNGKFYKDAACTQAITHFSEATQDPTEGYQVYVGYDVTQAAPKFLSPSASYTTATWYELTDDGSVQESGRKIKNNSGTYKNNGANGEFVKESEFAFVGDPYELKVLYRKGTETSGSNTYVTLGGHESWDIPSDETAGSFLLRKFNDTGYWSWNPGQAIANVTYGSNGSASVDKNAHTVTINLSGMNTSKYYKITTGGAGASQIASVTPSANTVRKVPDTEMSIVVKLAENTSGADKEMTVTIQEYSDGEGNTAFGSASVITITQDDESSAFAGNEITYSTTTSTRVKVLALPTRTYTYKVVDKSGRIAVKASADQTIFSTLSRSSIPSIIVSPFILDEDVAFYNSYDGSGRGNLVGHEITATDNVNHDIFVTYETENLNDKSINLSEDQEFNVVLNGEYIYYDSNDGLIKSKKTPDESEKASRFYFWKLRNRDPYHMLVDNMGARVTMGVSGDDEYVDVYEDDGSSSSENRQKGAWVISGIPSSVAAGSTTNVNVSKDAIASISVVVKGLTDGSSLSVNASDGNLSSISVSPTTVTAAGTATITATLAANATGSPISSTITLTESGSGTSTTTIVLIQDEENLGFTTSRLSAQQFIAKAGLQGGVYEVMVATGDDGTDATDASKYYYNIGRTSSTGIKIYDKATYAHGSSVLMFQLEQAIDYIYHLIDKYDHELLNLKSQSPDLVLPAEYQSPLVGAYHYYDIRQFDIDGDVYTLKEDPTPTELTKMSDLEATATNPTSSTADAYNAADANHKHEDATTVVDISEKAKKLKFTGNHYYKIGDAYYVVNVTKICYTDIYVTYDINNRVKFNDKASPYMLKFLQPHAGGYYLEDGNDKLTTKKIDAVYPYCNGDGSLNIYGEDMQKEQFNGGAATRPRWIWFFESEKKDPYHVMIHSSNTISFNNISHPTYLQTFAVDFVQGATTPKHIVTCGTLPTVGAEEITEYMVLGIDGQFRLRTTKTINDGTSDVRRDVTTLEQYWKTYNMAKLHVLGVNKNTDAYSIDEATWVVPKIDDPSTGGVDESTYRTTLTERDWHSYAIYANATRWNGYNDKTDGHEKKVVEKLEHWFQTFDMGDGTFNIESASIPPVLVLLDLHGWEIMRQPLPDISTYPGGEELAALRAYDSPMVDKYYFYSNATKASGCHKYSLRLQNGAERDQIKDKSGAHYSSSSLAELPEIDYSGVKSNGVLNDQYVIYTVKEEYAKSYEYTFTDNGNNTYTESGTASKFMVLLDSRFLRYNEGAASPSYFSKPIYEASNPVGGNVYDAIVSPCQSTVSGTSTSVDDDHDGYIDDINLWYVQPNQNIDKEMGIKYAEIAGNTGEPWTEFETKKYYYEKGKSGFDPYNIQLKNASNSNFVTSHLTSTALHEGVMIGNYSGSGGTTDMTLAAEYNYTGWDANTNTDSEGYDHTNITISNQTFMAVSDANGNMQLMPRFDHTKRVNLVNNSQYSYTTLQAPENHAKASASDNSSMGTQTAFFVRSQVFEYKIINNNGTESLRYKRGGDYYPTITDHFKSPIAKDFTYYTGLAEHETPVDREGNSAPWTAATGNLKRTATTVGLMNNQIKLLPTAGIYEYRVGTRGYFTYYKVEVSKGLLEKQITGSFADARLNDKDCNVIVRYEYDANHDHDGDRILEGKWFTVKLANKDLQSSETRVVTPVGETQGTNVNLFAGNDPLAGGGDVNDKPATVDEDDKKWQWKFRTAPADPSSDYYEAPDPYAIHLFNRYANYTTNPSEQPSPMAVGIKVPNANDGADRFALLSHSAGGYALAVAGTESYTYSFVNGAGMTIPDAAEPVAATTATEASFTQKAGIYDGVGSQIIVNDDVEHHFTYKVINNGGADYVVDNPGYLAVEATQDNDAADAHQFFPYLPYAAQTPLLRADKDYTYYGFARLNNNETPSDPSDDTYAVIPQTILYTLYGLYDDVVYVRYNKYDMDSTEFKVPNKRNKTIAEEGSGQVARDPGSHDVSMNIKGELPYNIIWYSDNMMESSNDLNITDGGSHALDGTSRYVWYFTGDDPYGLKIEHKKTGYYVYSSDGTTCSLHASNYTPFMLLRKSGYDGIGTGILQVTGGTNKLSGHGNTLVAGDPTHFIIFGLSVHDLIYHLIIARTCTEAEKASPESDQYVDIPYRTGDESTYQTSGTWTSSNVQRIYGTTQRDLAEGSPAGATYQLGETIAWGGESHTYSYDAGTVSIGDVLKVPNAFNRPNCTFEFYIQDIYDSDKTTSKTDLNNKYKGLKLKNLMSDSELIDKTVIVNVVYSFDKEVATNTGLDFVKSTNENLWYTFETQNGETPYLAHYTNAWGMQSMEGRETRYTNDYLWTPLGDVYGFKMYNRYMIKNSGSVDKVMTYAGTASAGKRLVVAKPGTEDYTVGNEVFELLKGDMDGYFRVQSVVNPGFYVIRNSSADNYTELSASYCDWMFGLDMTLLEPYYVRAGYIGGLNDTGKAAYMTEIGKGEGNYKITDLQNIVYSDANIVNFSEGYYRLHSVPGTPGIDPVRYASGYLHNIERDQDGNGNESDAIPMHFYSKAGVSGTFDGDTNPLESGFTETPATRGDIPVPATEDDPSTIFYLNPNVGADPEGVGDPNPRVIMSTQGLYVKGNATNEDEGHVVMTATSGDATKFSLIDIGGAVLLIANKLDPATRNYMHYGQSGNKYDLKYYHNSPTNEARWCIEPANNQGLMVAVNNGGDDYYYSTFCAPYDVKLPNDADGKTYYAYTCDRWDDQNLHPTRVPAVPEKHNEGKFVPAGTPVIIRTNDESGSMTLTLPSDTPTTGLSIDCIFSGKYLEQLLPLDGGTSWMNDVYTLGLPFVSNVSKDGDYGTTGDITAPLPEQASSGLGFYINATSNKENNERKARWDKNNRYVIHNKIYYRAESSGASAPSVQFVPVIFGDDEGGEEEPGGQEENENKNNRRVGDGCVYDILGRKVASEAEVKAGTWWQHLSPGIYIVDGQKVFVGVGRM